MSYLTRQAKKGKMNNIAGQSSSTKQRWSFQTGGKKNNNVMDLGDNKCKCANEICPSVFIAGL